MSRLESASARHLEDGLNRVTSQRRWRCSEYRVCRAWPALLVVAVGCVDDLTTDPEEQALVGSVQTVPLTRERSVQPGQAVELGLQILDEDDGGLDGVDCFFAVSDPEWLSFDTAASAESTQRIVSQVDSIDSVRAAGLAVARLTALDTGEARQVRVWAGVASADDVAADAAATALQVWQFNVTITVPADAAAGAAP